MLYYLGIGEKGEILTLSDSSTNLSIKTNTVEISMELNEIITEDLLSLRNISEFKMKALRAKRDILLKESDSLYIEAETKNKKVQEIKDYKQLLRDLPDVVDIETLSLENMNSLFPSPPSLKE